MATFDVLDAAAGDDVAALVARSVRDAPDAQGVIDSLFGTASGPPAVVRGDPRHGIVATVRRNGGAIRALCVHPEHRGRGLGRELLGAAEADLAGEEYIRIGADAPDYLWSGIDLDEIEMLCLAERAGYRRMEASFNMDVDLSALPPGIQDGPFIADATNRDEVGAFCRDHWPNWEDECVRALDKGSLAISRDDRGMNGFCAWNANRVGWIGPIAVRPGERSAGTGTPLLIAALQHLRDSGLEKAEIAWVGPMGFYARTVGARMCRTYVLMSKRIKVPERADA